jgi:multidrug efflux pump subunit AcrA (membrane-fusion protein)
VSVQERSGREFSGKLVRTANSLDPATRTLLAEIQVQNPGYVLLPGMYAQVRLANARSAPAILVPGDTLVVRSDGPQVAVVREDGSIHYQKVVLGRDFGAQSEIISGLAGGESLVINPGDDIQEGAMVKAKAARDTVPSQRQAK